MVSSHRTLRVVCTLLAVALIAASGCQRNKSRRFPKDDDEPVKPLPRITALSPDMGRLAGGTTVVLTGLNFMEPAKTEVWFGAHRAQIAADPDNSDEQLTVVSPAGDAPGPVDVKVVTEVGEAVKRDGFRYVVPEITAVVPARGPMSGGTHVTIVGHYFTDTADTTVMFGAGALDQLDVVDAHTIRGYTPTTDEAGKVDVTITNRFGTAVLAAGFDYVPGPRITAITPDRGPMSGGNTVTIEGRGFASSPEIVVQFDAVVLADPQVAPDGLSLSVVAPPVDRPQRVAVIVRNNFGEAVVPNGYAYHDDGPPVAITGITPSRGPLQGGTPVTITGVSFTDTEDVEVWIGGNALLDLAVLDSATITGATPPGAEAGAVDVTVICANGDDTLPGGFTYLPLPRIDDVSPAFGPVEGGTAVTITGAGFTSSADTEVRFGEAPATGVDVVDAFTLACVTPAGTGHGTVDVTVTSSNGSATAPDAFLYLATLGITAVAPPEGALAGGTHVEITGTGFTATGDMTVEFGDAAALSVVVVDGTLLTATTPAGAVPGPVTVTVTRLEGTQSASLVDGFTYLPPPAPPRIDAIDPAGGSIAGGTEVTLTGANFLAPVQVRLGVKALANLVVADPSRITGLTPPGDALGPVDVVVTTPHGEATLAGGFTYTPPPDAPQVTTLFPLGGITTASRVTIRGIATDEQGVAAVTVNGVAATLEAATGRFTYDAALNLGENIFTIGARDTTGVADDAAAVIRLVRFAMEPPDGPLGVAFDSRGDVLYSDHVQRGIFAASPQRVVKQPVPAWDIDGDGDMIDAVYIPNFMRIPEDGGDVEGPFTLNNAVFYALARWDENTVLATSLSNRTVWRLDTEHLEAQPLTDGDFAGGAHLVAPRGVAVLDAGTVAVSDWSEGTIVTIDANGMRTILSGAGIGSGPALARPGALAVLDADTLVVAVDGGLMRVARAGGQRTVLSDAQRGAGPPIRSIFDLEVDTDAGIVVVSDPSASAVLGVDAVTGDRFALLDGAYGTGPAVRQPVALAAAGPDLLVLDRADGALVRVSAASARTLVGAAHTLPLVRGASDLAVRGDTTAYIAGRASRNIVKVTLATGARTVLSGGTTGSGPLFTAPAALAAHDDGTLLVADAGAGAVYRVHEADGRRQALAQNAALFDASGVAASGDTVFVTTLGGAVLAINANGVVAELARVPEAVTSITPLAQGSALLTTMSAVHVIDTTTGNIQTLSGDGPALVRILNAARDAQGRVFVADAARKAIIQVRAQTPADRVLFSR